jgi:hypothetical protein
MTSDKIKWIAAEWQSVTMEARARMRIQKTTLEYWALITEIAGAITIAVSVVYRGVQVHGARKFYGARLIITHCRFRAGLASRTSFTSLPSVKSWIWQLCLARTGR